MYWRILCMCVCLFLSLSICIYNSWSVCLTHHLFFPDILDINISYMLFPPEGMLNVKKFFFPHRILYTIYTFFAGGMLMNSLSLVVLLVALLHCMTRITVLPSWLPFQRYIFTDIVMITSQSFFYFSEVHFHWQCHNY